MKMRVLLVSGLAAMAMGVLTANAANAGEAREVRVRYGELDLATEQGAKALYARLRSGARQACSMHDGHELRQRAKFQECYNEALSEAVVKVNRANVAALHAQSRNARAS